MSRLPVILLLLTPSACASEAADVRIHEVTRRDSAGVEIVEVPGELLDKLPAWQIAPAPSLELGRAEGNGADVFGSISSVVALDEERLAIVDGRASEIKLFTHAGEFLRAVGAKGEGPGEFAQTPIVRPHSAGGLITFDWSLGRATVFDSLGNVVETARYDPSSCSFIPLGNETPIACLPRGLLDSGSALVARDERPSLAPELVGRDFSDLGVTFGLMSTGGYRALARIPYERIGVRSERRPDGAERVTLVTPEARRPGSKRFGN